MCVCIFCRVIYLALILISPLWMCVCVCVGSSLYRPLDDLYYVFFREKIKRRKVFILSWLRFISWLYAAYYIVNVHNLYIFIFCAVYCSWCCVHSFLFSKFRQIYISFSPESFFFCFITLGSVYETVRSNHSSQNVILKFNIASIIHSSANFGFMFHFTSWFFCLLCFFCCFTFFVSGVYFLSFSWLYRYNVGDLLLSCLNI